MAYSVTLHTTKPANKNWWGPANTAKSAALRTLTTSTAGLISSASGVSPANANVWVTHQLWESKAHYDAYAAALASNAYWQERIAYGQTNGFVVTRHEGDITLA